MVAGSRLAVPREALRERILRDGFLGFKVFLDWQGDDYGERTVEDMLGANEMDVADELSLVVLLHVPRAGRLADPVVQRGVRWLATRWPRARIVLAHCGRCYLPAEMERAVGAIRDLPNVWLDTSMVMEEGVLAVLFGADRQLARGLRDRLPRGGDEGPARARARPLGGHRAGRLPRQRLPREGAPASTSP